MIVSVDLSGYVIVAVPSFPTSTVVPSGNLSLFASSIAFLTAFFSSSVKLSLFATFVFAGTAGSVLSAVVFSAFLTVLSGVNLPISLPSLSFTVTDPSLPTSIVASFGKFGFASLTACSTLPFSSSVNLDGSFTSTGVGALIFSITVSACESCPSFWFSPVPCVTVTAPSLDTLMLASCGRIGFAFLTAAITLSFSSCVKFVLSSTSVFSGATNFMILSVFSAFLTVLAGSIVLFPSVPIGTVTVPSSATWISSYVKSSSLLAALTASFTACFSASVSLLVSATVVIAGAFNVLPALSNGFTVSLPSNVPVFFPSAVVTVTLPLLSTSILSPSARLFFALTAAATLSLSSWVKLVTSFTSVLSGASSLRIVSFCTTVLSAGISPVLPFWLIVTLPSSPTVISSSFKFLSGLASLTASLTACFSLSVNFVLSSTLTGSFGGLNLTVTSFCVTVLSGVIVPVWPFFVTVTVPSSATTTSAGVKFKSGFALITAASTFSCSGSVNDLVSFTSTFSGSFNFKGSLLVCSQTA